MVLRRHLDHRELARGVDFVIGDVTLLLQDAGDFRLHLRIGSQDFGLACTAGIAKAGEKICDGIGECAHVLLGSWLLLLLRALEAGLV